ncbi:SDR family oxidoreductase [Burkholderia contaminans]|nr:SDR family oxidoreductase [Burkholderia contaminans]
MRGARATCRHSSSKAWSRGTRVNAVCTGGIARTAITVRPENRDDNARPTQSTPMAQLGASRDVAGARTWLCSPAARVMTGQAIAVDGGFTVC